MTKNVNLPKMLINYQIFFSYSKQTNEYGCRYLKHHLYILGDKHPINFLYVCYSKANSQMWFALQNII